MERDFSCLIGSKDEKSFRPISRDSLFGRQRSLSDFQLSPSTPSPTFKKSPRLRPTTPRDVPSRCDVKLNYTCPMCKVSSASGAFEFPLRWYVSSTPHIREGFCSFKCLESFKNLKTSLNACMQGIPNDSIEWSSAMGRVLYEAQSRGFKVCFSRYNRERTTCASILTPKETYKGYCKACDETCEGCDEVKRSCQCCHLCKKTINSPECCYYRDL